MSVGQSQFVVCYLSSVVWGPLNTYTLGLRKSGCLTCNDQEMSHEGGLKILEIGTKLCQKSLEQRETQSVCLLLPTNCGIIKRIKPCLPNNCFSILPKRSVLGKGMIY
jgi:hypothetical protein